MQNKEQQDQIKAMKLVIMMEEVLAQTIFANLLHAKEWLWQSESKGKYSAPMLNEDTTKEVAKSFGPSAKPRVKANTC